MEYRISSKNGGQRTNTAEFTRESGKPLYDQFRGEILNMFNRGFCKKQTSRDTYCQKDNSPFSTLWNLECLFP